MFYRKIDDEYYEIDEVWYRPNGKEYLVKTPRQVTGRKRQFQFKDDDYYYINKNIYLNAEPITEVEFLLALEEAAEEVTKWMAGKINEPPYALPPREFSVRRSYYKTYTVEDWDALIEYHTEDNQ